MKVLYCAEVVEFDSFNKAIDLCRDLANRGIDVIKLEVDRDIEVSEPVEIDFEGLTINMKFHKFNYTGSAPCFNIAKDIQITTKNCSFNEKAIEFPSGSFELMNYTKEDAKYFEGLIK